MSGIVFGLWQTRKGEYVGAEHLLGRLLRTGRCYAAELFLIDGDHSGTVRCGCFAADADGGTSEFALDTWFWDEGENFWKCTNTYWYQYNFIRFINLIKLNLPIVIGIGAFVGICLMGSIMVSKSAINRRYDYEQRIMELDRWHHENAEAISFGLFYRENYPKKYREWQSGRWQQDITYCDSLIKVNSLDGLKRLH